MQLLSVHRIDAGREVREMLVVDLQRNVIEAFIQSDDAVLKNLFALESEQSQLATKSGVEPQLGIGADLQDITF